jgi:hypothetical protein
MENEQKTVDYQAVLADLEVKRDELEQAITAIKRMLGESVEGSSTGQRKQPQTGNALTPTVFFGMSVGDATKHYLSTAKEPKSAPEIAKALQDHGIKTVSKNFNVIVFSTLTRLETSGEIVRPKRGLWGLKEWYPGHRPAKKEIAEKKDEPVTPTKVSAKIEPKQKPKKTKASAATTAASAGANA